MDDEWDDLYDEYESQQKVTGQVPAGQPQKEDVKTAPSAVDGTGRESETDNDFIDNDVSDAVDGDTDETDYNPDDSVTAGTQPEKSEESASGTGYDSEEFDEKGVSYKNRYLGLKRKLEAQKTRDAAINSVNQPLGVNPYQSTSTGTQSLPAGQSSLEEQAVEIEAKLVQTESRDEYVRLQRKLSQIDANITLRDKIAEQESERYQNDMNTRIISEYPDVLNPVTPLGQRANAYLMNVYKGKPEYAELAVQRAARDLDIQPKTAKSVTKVVQRLVRSQATAPVTERTVASQQQKPLPQLTPYQLKIAKEWGQDPKRVARMQQILQQQQRNGK